MFWARCSTLLTSWLVPSPPPHTLQSVLGDFFDLVTLLTACIVFALLCSMNSRIRRAFSDCTRQIPLLQSRSPSPHFFPHLQIPTVDGRAPTPAQKGER